MEQKEQFNLFEMYLQELRSVNEFFLMNTTELL